MHTPLSIIVAAVLGSTVRVLLKSKLSCYRRCVHILCGPPMAIFVAPWITENFSPNHDMVAQQAMAFFTGLTGLTLIEIALKLLDKRGDALANRLADTYIK